MAQARVQGPPAVQTLAPHGVGHHEPEDAHAATAHFWRRGRDERGEPPRPCDLGVVAPADTRQAGREGEGEEARKEAWGGG